MGDTGIAIRRMEKLQAKPVGLSKYVRKFNVENLPRRPKMQDVYEGIARNKLSMGR